MGREVFLVRDTVVVWRGVIEASERREARTTREYFDEAWQRALRDGAVTADDGDCVQFRSSMPSDTGAVSAEGGLVEGPLSH